MKLLLLGVLDEAAPLISKQIRGRSCPWITPHNKAEMNARDHLLRKHRKSGLPADKSVYKRKRNLVNQLLKKSKNEYGKNLLKESAGNSAKFWNAIKRIFPTKNKNKNSTSFTIDGVRTTDPVLISRTFCTYYSSVVGNLKKSMTIFGNLIWREPGNNFIQTDSAFKLAPTTAGEVFCSIKKLKKTKSTGLDNIPTVLLRDCADSLCSPLSYLINMSFSTGQFPTEWKKSKVSPIYKNGPKSNIENYRPISVIPAISKVIEKIVHSQLYGYMEQNNLLCDQQFGFRKKRSTEIAATLFFDDIKTER